MYLKEYDHITVMSGETVINQTNENAEGSTSTTSTVTSEPSDTIEPDENVDFEMD